MKIRIKRSITRRTLSLYGLLALMALGTGASSHAQNGPNLQFGPVNPEFLRAQQDRAAVFGNVLPNYGVQPSPLALMPMTSNRLLFDAPMATTLPSTYDLRLLNRLSPVENQGQCGDCWAFATMGSLESCLLPEQLCSFSENNLKDTSGFDYGWNGGGNRDMSTAYFARWSGPVNTSADPYNPNSGVSPANLAPSKHVQEVLFLPDRASATDNNAIKQALMTYGAVLTYFDMDESLLYQSGSNTTYYNPNGSSINHAVDIVGWDDNYTASNFKTPPPGNGAFIVRNSWGTSFGQGGYFYVSYYDKWTGCGGGNSVFDDAEPVDNYAQIYQYDPLGCIQSIGLNGKTNLWFSNVFTATSASNIAAVSFYTMAPNTNYNITVYSNVSNTPINANSPYTTQSGIISTPGYHTVALSTPIMLTAQQKFSVVIEASANYSSLIPVQYPIPGYSSAATATAGHSFVSLDGKTWYDLTTLQPNMGVCVKAFTQAAPPAVANVTFSPNGGAYNTAQNVTIQCATSGAAIHYTTNGNAPTESDPVVTGPVTVSQSLTLKAGAWMSGFAPSAITSATYTIAAYPTSLTVTPVSGTYGQTVTLKATLQCTSPAGPISGQTLSFQLNGASVGTGATNASGVATCSVKIANALAIGANPIQITYAGNTGYKAASGVGALMVGKATTQLSVKNASGTPGTRVSLTATLTRASDGSALANETMSFTVTGGAAITATTNASGVATFSYTIPKSGKVGATSFSVAFAGDAKNAAGSTTGTVSISAN